MTIVLKFGGSLVERGGYLSLLEDVAKVKEPIVMVHGGGRIVTDMSEKLGIKPRFVVSPSGMRSRLTDEKTIEVFQMVVAGKVNKDIVRHLQRLGVNAIGLSGIDGYLLKAKRKERILIVDEHGRRRFIDGGYTGKIVEVNTPLLKSIVEMGFTPVIAPLALSLEYEPLNIDADAVAMEVATALNVEKLIFMTDVDGVFLDGKLVKEVVLPQDAEMWRKVGHGMMRKLYSAIKAVNEGDVKEAFIANGTIKNPLLSVLRGETGTHVYK